jgi:hypothetical protein
MDPKPKRRVLALSLYCSLLLTLGGAWFAHRVSAELRAHGAALGRELDAFHELSGRVTEIDFNGQPLSVSTLVLEQPVERVLARFTSLCDRELGALPRELGDSFGKDVFTPVLQRMLVLRDLNEDGTGIGVCLAGLGDDGLSGLLARTRRFAGTHDVSELGKLRYAHLRTLDAQHTHVILVSAEGSLNLDQLAPAGDAAGEDPLGVRPPASKRVLAASAHGTPFRFAGYHSNLPVAEALPAFLERVEAAGYERVQRPSKAEADASARTGILYRQDQNAFLISSHDQAHGSVLSVVQIADSDVPAPFARIVP